MTDLTSVTFRGGDILVTTDQQIALKPVCEAMGLDANAQAQRLKRQPWATTCVTHAVAEDGKTREMFTVDRRTFTMWLATIETSRLKDEAVRDQVAIFQREAADVLDAYFHEGGAINPRATEDQLGQMFSRLRAQAETLALFDATMLHPDHKRAYGTILAAQLMGAKPELDPGTRPLYAQEYLREKGLPAKDLKSTSPTFGKRAKAAYVLKYGKDPERYPLSLPNGQVREVNAYTEADRDLLDSVWNEHYAGVSA